MAGAQRWLDLYRLSWALSEEWTAEVTGDWRFVAEGIVAAGPW